MRMSSPFLLNSVHFPFFPMAAESPDSHPATPPPTILTRDKQGLSLLSHVTASQVEPIAAVQNLPCSQAKFSPDGTLVAVAAAGGGVRLIHVPSGEQRLHMPLEGVQALAFSPKGSYLQASEGFKVFQRLSAPAGGGQAESNLTVSVLTLLFPSSLPNMSSQVKVFQRPSAPAGGGQAESNLTVSVLTLLFPSSSLPNMSRCFNVPQHQQGRRAGGEQSDGAAGVCLCFNGPQHQSGPGAGFMVFQRPSAPAGGGQAEPNLTVRRVFQRPSAPAGGGQAEPNLTVRRVSVYALNLLVFSPPPFPPQRQVFQRPSAPPAGGGQAEPNLTVRRVFQRPTPAPAGGGQAEPNLTVRRVSDGEVVWRQVQKTFNSAAWWVDGEWYGWVLRHGPSMQFSADESVACRPVNGEVQLFTGADLAAGVAARLKVPGMTSAQLAPSPPSHIAVFAPEAKGAPASVRIFTRDSATPSSSSSSAAAPPAPIARRSFFKCSAVRLVWNVGTTAVLAWTHSDVDKTNQSYYGESGLHFLAADGSFEGAVPL
ncbi:unnamed protein product, partial [Closterium sp. NIES-65]